MTKLVTLTTEELLSRMYWGTTTEERAEIRRRLEEGEQKAAALKRMGRMYANLALRNTRLQEQADRMRKALEEIEDRAECVPTILEIARAALQPVTKTSV